MSFARDMERICKKHQLNMEQFVRAVKIELFTGVIRDTRVDEGRLRGDWQTSTGAPKTDAIDRMDKTKQGQDGGAAQADVINTVTADGVDYLTNNMPYAPVWEREDGMIVKNVARLRQIMKKAAK